MKEEMEERRLAENFEGDAEDSERNVPVMGIKGGEEWETSRIEQREGEEIWRDFQENPDRNGNAEYAEKFGSSEKKRSNEIVVVFQEKTSLLSLSSSQIFHRLHRSPHRLYGPRAAPPSSYTCHSAAATTAALRSISGYVTARRSASNGSRTQTRLLVRGGTPGEARRRAVRVVGDVYAILGRYRKYSVRFVSFGEVQSKRWSLC